MFVEMNGTEVTRVRREQGLTKKALAGAAGVGEHTIKRAEDGWLLLPATVHQIAGALGVDAHTLGKRVQ